MTTELIDTKQVELDAEFINNAMEMAERGAAMAVTGAIQAGGRLNDVKEQIPHGEWSAWIGKNLNYSHDIAVRYMRIASNSVRAPNLKDAKSIREALRMIAAEKTESELETAPRSERKPANVTITTPADEPAEVDDDPTPDPPTNRKTAKGSEKASEDKKPRTAAITPEILPDEPNKEKDHSTGIVDAWLAANTLDDVIDTWCGADETPKSLAKHLRKLADKLDPPDESPKPETVPTIAKLVKAIPDEVGSLRGVIEKWARHKQSLQGKARVRSMESWETMIDQMLKACDRHGVSEVSESIRSSMANGYTGWDIELKKTNGSNGNGKTKHNGRSRGLTADEVFS